MFSTKVPCPPELVAVTVYAADAAVPVGAPVMLPSRVSKLRPAGSAGVMDHDVMAPPLFVGTSGVIANPGASAMVPPLVYPTVGGTSLTAIVSLNVVLPPGFVAVTV